MEKKFQCSKCSKIFFRKRNFLEHQKTFHSKLLKFYCCRKCNFTSRTLGNFNKHLGLKHNPYFNIIKSCGINGCDIKFKSLKSLKNHTELVHKKSIDPNFFEKERKKMIQLSKTKEKIHSEEDYLKIININNNKDYFHTCDNDFLDLIFLDDPVNYELCFSYMLNLVSEKSNSVII